MTPSEQAAVDALRRVTRRCTCRGLITADPKEPTAVTGAVQAHQQTLGHRLWAVSGGMDQMLTPRERYASVPDVLGVVRLRKVG